MMENSAPRLLVVGCNYHTRWQTKRGMRFVLAEIEGTRARLITRETKKDFWTNVEDLIFIETEHNIYKADKIMRKRQPTMNRGNDA